MSRSPTPTPRSATRRRRSPTTTPLSPRRRSELADAQQREEAQYELFCKPGPGNGGAGHHQLLVGAVQGQQLFRPAGQSGLLSTRSWTTDRRVIRGPSDPAGGDCGEESRSGEPTRRRWKPPKRNWRPRKSSSAPSGTRPTSWSRRSTTTRAEYQATLDGTGGRGAPHRAAGRANVRRSWRNRWRRRERTTTLTPGGYIWPVDSRYITSTVGGRNTPGGVGSTNHKGTDIGRVGYTSPVYAAKAGHSHHRPAVQLLRQLCGHFPRHAATPPSTPT